MVDLSVVIPARNEEWLSRTVEDVVDGIRGRTEVIVVLDGEWAKPPLIQHDQVHIVKLGSPIGQRAATNLGIRLSSGKLAMKLDGHCTVQKGFDLPLITAAKQLGPTVCQVPAQYNLHVYDWVCEKGHRKYQGPTPKNGCDFQRVADGPKCGAPMARQVVWKRRRGRLTTSWMFDSTLHFQYWNEFGRANKAIIHDVMSCLGACWVVDKEHFLEELGGLDERHGSWGQMGTEIACKHWLSGGRLVVNKGSWFAHLFRTQGGDFTFPYPLSGDAQQEARRHSRWLWQGGHWPKATRNLAWLVNHFRDADGDIPGWTKEQIDALGPPTVEERRPSAGPAPDRIGDTSDRGPGVVTRVREKTAGCVYYTDGSAPEHVLHAVHTQLRRAAEGLPIVHVGLASRVKGTPSEARCDILVEGERGPLAMFEQILAGLEALNTEYAFLCEHDVLYHESHFEFRPDVDNAYFYNMNFWKVDADVGKAVTFIAKQVSSLCANRQLLIQHYRRRIQLCKTIGFSRKMGFEPGSHKRAERVDDFTSREWRSEQPILDVRHGKNFTETRWSTSQFRSPCSCRGWTERAVAPGWPYLPGRFRELLTALAK